jgi:uncharacterized protein DUF4126
VTGLPPDLQVLAHPVVLIAAGAMYAVEFIADKAPFITPVWDVIHTVIRPLGASLLAPQIVFQWSLSAENSWNSLAIRTSPAFAAASGRF